MNHLKILVVDDEEGMRLAVARALGRYSITLPEIEGPISFDISQAGDGESAYQALAASPPDILLLDHKLPDTTGIEILGWVAERNLDCLTVMITAYASLETAITATKRGAYDFLAKPFTPEELKAAVRKAAKHLVLQRQARKLAEEKRQVRFQTMSVVVHELKAPLGAVEGYLYLLRDRPAGDNWSAYEKAIERSLIRLQGMRKLITDLLDLTRLESGQKKREFAEVDLVNVAQTAIDGVAADAKLKNVTVGLDAPEKLTIWADRGELEIVFNNLLTNAVKYNRADGKVEVTIAPADGQVKIVVADTGIGMSPEECAKLFGEFVRIKNKKTKDIPGTGLGLSILKKIAQLYGGDVTVASQADVGTTFTVTVARGEAPAA